MVELSQMHYLLPYKHFLDNRSAFCTEPILYSQLVNDTENTMRRVLFACGMGACQDTLDEAVRCLSIDSQVGTFLSQQNVREIKPTEQVDPGRMLAVAMNLGLSRAEGAKFTS